MPISDYKLFIFDWDGTLSTSTLLVKLSRFLQRRYSVDYIKAHFRDYEKKGIKGIQVREEVNRTYAQLYELYSYFSKPRLQPGVVELLRELKERRKKVAIFSDSARYRLVREIRMLGLTSYVDFILSAESIGRYKPNPQGLLVIAQHFEIKKSDSLYVGDMASDILTARFARIDICSMGNGIDPYKLLKELKPDYLFRNLVEMKERLLGQAGELGSSATFIRRRAPSAHDS